MIRCAGNGGIRIQSLSSTLLSSAALPLLHPYHSIVPRSLPHSANHSSPSILSSSLFLHCRPYSSSRLLSSSPSPSLAHSASSSSSLSIPLTCTNEKINGRDLNEKIRSAAPEDSIVVPKGWRAELFKAKLNFGVSLTALIGYFASVTTLTPSLPLFITAAAVFSGTFMTGAAAAVWNEYMEMHQDSLMKRTRTKRPLALYWIFHDKNRAPITPTTALIQSAILFGTGVGSLALFASPTSALIAACTSILYAPIYTYLKRITSWNTNIGAIVGALPPLIGYCADLGMEGLNMHAFSLFYTVYCWQFMHFNVISLTYARDYANAGFQMTAVTNPRWAKQSIFVHLSALCLLPFIMVPHVYSPMLLVTTIPLNAIVAYYLYQWAKVKDTESPQFKKTTTKVLAILGVYVLAMLANCAIFHRPHLATDDNTDDPHQSLFPFLNRFRQTSRHYCAYLLLRSMESDLVSSLVPDVEKIRSQLQSVIEETHPNLQPEESVRRERERLKREKNEKK